VLAVAVAAHAIVSQLLYAGLIAPIDVSAAQRQGAATLMYCGGVITELLSGRWATP
jgi:putative membrane protein